jgi:hypothetical protein
VPSQEAIRRAHCVGHGVVAETASLRPCCLCSQDLASTRGCSLSWFFSPRFLSA